MGNILGIIHKVGSAAAGAVELFIRNVKNTKYKKINISTARTTLSLGNAPFSSMGSAWFVANDSGYNYIFSYQVAISSGGSWMYRIGRFNYSSSTTYSQPVIDGFGFLYYQGYTYAFGYNWGRKKEGLPSSSNSWSTITIPSDLKTSTKYVICNGNIHALGAGSDYLKHYKYDGNTWSTDISLPYSGSGASFCTANNKIYMLGGYNNKLGFYSYDGESWQEESVLPYEAVNLESVYYKTYINILGGTRYFEGSSTDSYRHYIYDFKTKEWVSVGSTSIYPTLVAELNNSLYIANGSTGKCAIIVYDYITYTER